MATDSRVVNVLPAEPKKAGVKTTVEELEDQGICVLKPETKQNAFTKIQELEAQGICVLQVDPKVVSFSQGGFQPMKLTKEFECQYPTLDPNVTRVSEPLPFPENLKDVIAWTDAFVDRIASLTQAEEQKTAGRLEFLFEQIDKLESIRDKLQVDLEISRGETKSAKAETAEVRETLAIADEVRAAQDLKITHLEEEQTKATAAISELREKLHASEQDVLLLELALAQLKQEDEREDAEHEADHETIRQLEKNEKEDHEKIRELEKLEKEDQKKIRKLENHDKKDHKKIAKLRERLVEEEKQKNEALAEVGQLTIDLKLETQKVENKQNAIDCLIAEKAKLQTEVECLEADNTKLCTELEEVKNVLKKKTVETEALVEALRADVDAGRQRIAEQSAKLEEARSEADSLQKQIRACEAEVSTLKTEKEHTEAELTQAQGELSKAVTEIGGLKTEVGKIRGTITHHETEKEEAQTEVAQLTVKLQELRNEGRAAKKSYEAEKKKIVEEWAKKLATAEEEVIDREAELKQANEKLATERINQHKEFVGTSPDAVDTLRKQVTKLETDLTAAKAKVEELTKRLLPDRLPKPITILTVEYGSRFFTEEKDKKLFAALYKHADDGTDFQITNEFFAVDDHWRICKNSSCKKQPKCIHHDPWKGVTKSVCITYQLDGKDAPKLIVARELEKVNFKTWQNREDRWKH